MALKPWHGFLGLRSYPTVLDRDLRELEIVLKDMRTNLGRLLAEDSLTTETTEAVTTDTEVIAGAGLTGGGALVGDVTLDVGAGTGISVSANTVSISASFLGANPTALVGNTAVNGTATTYMRSDAAPALDLTLARNWSAGVHTFAVRDVHNGGIDLGTSGRLDSNVATSSSAISFLFQPSVSLAANTGAETRGIYKFLDQAGEPAVIVWPDRRVEIGDDRAALQATADAQLAVIPAASTFAGGMLFFPTGSTSSGVSLTTSGASGNFIYGAFFSTLAASSSLATAVAGGIFVGHTGFVTGNSAYGAIMRANSATSITNSGKTFTGYGFNVTSPSMPTGSSSAFGSFGDYYGGRINAPALAARIVNSYGLYLEEVVSNNVTNVIKNGIFLAAATNGYKAIAIGNQDNYISYLSANGIKFNANSAGGFIWSVGATDQITITSSTMALVDTSSAYLIKTSGSTGVTLGGVSDKVAFFNTAPIIQPDGSASVHTTLNSLGLRLDAASDTYGIVCANDEVMCVDDEVVVI